MSLVPDIPRFSQSAVHDSIHELKLQRVLAPYEWNPAAFQNFSITAPTGGQTTLKSAPSAATMKIADMRDSALAEIDRYSRYQEGWDGYHAKRFSARLLLFARTFVELAAVYFELANAPLTGITTGPASDGSLDIEINAESRRLIMTFYDDLPEVQIYRVERGHETYETVPFKGVALVTELARLATSGAV